MAGWIQERTAAIPQLPETLYHYTTARPLLNIFETRELWATNAAYTNDQTEILHSVRQLKQIAEENLKDRQNDPAADTMIQAADDFYTIVEAYLVCFCTHGDLLSQWRGYGQQGGYAIGFDTAGFKPLLESGRVQLMPVIYDIAEQDRLIRDLVTRWRAVFKDIPTADDNSQVRRLGAFLFAQCFAMLAVALKSPAFAEEQEWRLVHRRQVILEDPSGLRVRFRDRDSMVTPYVALSAVPENAQTLSVSRIVVGPTKYPQLAGFGLARLLGTLGYKDDTVDIARSDVPLRA
jgi:hypothetical protein